MQGAMYRLASIACLCCLFGPTAVYAEGWDDFSNNLATDLAPFLSLFGEQVTKQYLSESIYNIDYIIFALAPLGILTAIVSVIRVCGSPTMRALIGRAQEGRGIAEAELCTSTSRDVCELYNNGSIARVFGRPKILEIVHDPKNQNFQDGTVGIHTFQEYLGREEGRNEWQVPQENQESAFGPNLSLNIGIKRKSPVIFRAVATIGSFVQAGVLLFAMIVTYYLTWEKDGSRPGSYACPLFVVGTLLIFCGIFLCAYLIGDSTDERCCRRKDAVSSAKPLASKIYWVQPGKQVLGDQTFDPFCYSDEKEPLQQYITSWRSRLEAPKLLVPTAIGVTMTGFILQFTGLRGLHSTVSVAQLGAIILMSAARAGLRMQRLSPEDNYLAKFPDQVVRHELDWLAVRLGQSQLRTQGSRIARMAQQSTIQPSWRFCGASRKQERITVQSPCTSLLDESNIVSTMLAYRTRLAQLTQPQGNQSSSVTSSAYLDVAMVEVRDVAQRLGLAIESAVNTVFNEGPSIRDEWNKAESLFWNYDGEVLCKEPATHVENYQDSIEMTDRRCLSLRFERVDRRGPWKLQNKLALEGILGLWVWSLTSVSAPETPHPENQPSVSQTPTVEPRRIFSFQQSTTETDLDLWFGGATVRLEDTMLDLNSPQLGNPDTIWEHDEDTYRCRLDLSGDPQSTKRIRLFNWQAIELLLDQQATKFKIWSAPATGDLPVLCAQEIFGWFVKSILGVVDHLGSIEVQSETRTFRLTNRLANELSRSLTSTKLGSQEDALTCILPAMISRLELSSAGDAVAAAWKSADQHRKRCEWTQANAILKWSWKICTQLNTSTAGIGQSGLWNERCERNAIALGELYRWSLRDNDASKVFGREGVMWLLTQKSTLNTNFLMAAREAIDRYSEIARILIDTSGHAQIAQEPLSAVANNRTAILARLTLPEPAKDEEKGFTLCSATKHGWVEVVLALLESGTEPNFKNTEEEMRTPLSYASEQGHVDIVRELMESGALPHMADATHRAPLSYASEAGESSVIELLLRDQRVDPDARDRYGQTPLWWAASLGHHTAVELLLNTTKVDIDIQNHDKQTPLFQAASKGWTIVVKQLIEKGADFMISDEDGTTSLHQAAEGGHIEMVRLLLAKGADATVRNENGETPLHGASKSGSHEVIKLLVEEGVDFRVLDKEGQTPMHAASKFGQVKVLQSLLDAGADAGVEDKKGRTPLFTASESGHAQAMDILLQRVANASVGSIDGEMPLFAASKNGHLEAVELLLKSGADMTATNFSVYHWIPLHVASNNGHVEVVKRLLAEGADVAATNLNGWTPLHAASECGHVEVVKVLLKNGADVSVKSDVNWTPLYGASVSGHTDVARHLLEMKADFSIRKSDGWTCLNAASANGNSEIVRLLLEKGADMSVASDDGQTPLYSSSAIGSVDTVDLLLNAIDEASGEDGHLSIWRQDIQGSFEAASAGGHFAVVSLFLRRKADMVVNSDALFGASSNNHADIVELLLESGIDKSISMDAIEGSIQAASSANYFDVVKLLLAKRDNMRYYRSQGVQVTHL